MAVKLYKDSHVRMYMKMARDVGEYKNGCFSRHIGVVIVNPKGTKVVGQGYNSPPRDTPHCDERKYLEECFWPQLSDADREAVTKYFGKKTTQFTIEGCEMYITKENFVGRAEGCKTCPRRFIGAGPGKRLELCSCVHAETNAIVNAGQDLTDCVMYCWCPTPCNECTKLIINSGIRTVFCLGTGEVYSPSSKWMFEQAGVEVIEVTKEWVESE
jgi:deoxycytidylate deaminase